MEFGIVDEIIPEPLGGAHRDHTAAAAAVKNALMRNLRELESLDADSLVEARYRKYKAMGRFVEVPVGA
jgi:acetyl-CoA carboxylase carboxyl transferase subunit alpha